MGSYWAYYELGWGGWWFWDPVENASFIPWLDRNRSAAFGNRHGKTRGAEGVDGIAGSLIITFSMSLLGTFLVRSGVLTSVHSLSPPIPDRGLFILAILIAVHRRIAVRCSPLRAPLLRKAGGLFAANLARGRAGLQQPVSRRPPPPPC